jgi:hypothetical protein
VAVTTRPEVGDHITIDSLEYAKIGELKTSQTDSIE